MPSLDKERANRSPDLNAADMELARIAQDCIMAALDRSRAASITLTTDEGSHPRVDVPPAALKLIAQVLGAMSEGRSVALMPGDRELTTVEAANVLNVSRPFLIKELEAGKLPFRKVGSHRRIALDDLLSYEKDMRARQEKALERIAENARKLGLEY